MLRALYPNRVHRGIVLNCLEWHLYHLIKQNACLVDVPGLPSLDQHNMETLNLGGLFQELLLRSSDEVQDSTHQTNQAHCNSGYLNFGSRTIFGPSSERTAQELSCDVAKRAIRLIGEIRQANGNEMPSLILNRISTLKEYESTHVTISVSGFLSGDTDKKQHWQGLVQHLQGHSTDIDANAFSLTW